MKRLICFLMLLFVVTGCSYKYNIEIDKKKTVLEELNIYELNSVFVNKGTSANSFVDININIYKKDSSLSQYNISKKISDPSSGVIASASYDSFSDYTKKTKVKKNLFGRIELYEDSNYGYFIASDYRGDVFFTDEESDFINDKVEFNLKLPFEVISNNADNIDTEKGIYTWYFDKDINDKEVNVKFNLKKIVIKENIFIKYIYLFLIPVFIFMIVLFIIIKNKRVNKI